MPFKYKISSILRRRFRANHILFSDFIIMRFYQSYVRTGVFYVLSSESEYCEQYIRFARSYEFTISYIELNRFQR
jgi:hypothetical protein